MYGILYLPAIPKFELAPRLEISPVSSKGFRFSRGASSVMRFGSPRPASSCFCFSQQLRWKMVELKHRRD